VNFDGQRPTFPLVPQETPAPSRNLSIVAALRGITSVESVPFTVPPGAELRFAVGVHAPATRPPGQVGARVSVVDDSGSRTVWRTRMPASNSEWQDRRVSLAAFAGRRVRLRFTTRPGRGARDAGVNAVFAEPVVLRRDRGSRGRST
jgi:hypothetical protein